MTIAALAPTDLRSLANIVGEDYVTSRESDRIHYTTDSLSRSMIIWRSGKPMYWPQAIVWPETTEQVAKIVRWAKRRQLPLIAFGGGSGVCGGTTPVRGGVIVDLKRMNRIVSIDEQQGRALVEAGINNLTLEEALNEQGWTLGHFPSSIMVATLGGCVAARGAGQLSSKYGTIDDMVENVEVVLPSGEILPLSAQEVPGYAEVQPRSLFMGSEGTLGIITRCTLRIHRKAEAARYRGVSFVHLSQGLKAMRKIMQSGLRPSVLRLYDPLDSLLLQWGYEKDASGTLNRVTSSLQGTWPFSTAKVLQPVFSKVKHGAKNRALLQMLQHPRFTDFVSQRLPVNCILVLGFEGDPQMIPIEEQEALKLCRQGLSRDEGQTVGHHWLKHRYSVSYKLPEMFTEGHFADTIEVAATWDSIEELYQKMRRAMSRHCFVMAHFSHAYPEGCSIYFTFVAHGNNAKQELRLYDQIWREAMEACLECGGTITHHHGVGFLKGKYMVRELGRLMDLFKEIKNDLDPLGIMNPGKMGL